MRKLSPNTGGHPFRLDDLMQIQLGLAEVLKGIGSAFNQGGPCILNGVAITNTLLNGPTWTAGYIYYNGEIFYVPASSVGAGNLGPGENYYWQIQQFTQNPVTSVKPYTVLYQNGLPDGGASEPANGVFLNRIMALVAATGPGTYGGILQSSVPYIQGTMINGGLTPVGGIIMWSGSVSANFYTSGANAGLGFGPMTGWAICNGNINNGTVNLVDKFVVGSGNLYANQSTGGNASVTLTAAQSGFPGSTLAANPGPVNAYVEITDPQHSHSITMVDGNNNVGHTGQPSDGQSGGNDVLGNTNGASTGLNSSNVIVHIEPHGAVESVSILPPFLALAYIQRIS